MQKVAMYFKKTFDTDAPFTSFNSIYKVEGGKLLGNES